MKIAKKQLIKLIKEQVKGTSNIENAFEIMQKNDALTFLSKKLTPFLGFSPKFKMALKRDYIVIESENFIEKLNKFDKLLFKSITIDLTGEFSENKVWFSINASYQHPSGGSNGISIIWFNIWYDCATNEWKEGRSIS